MQKINILFILLTIILSVKAKTGNNCDDKAILNGKQLIYDVFSDKKRVYNGPSSCFTLKSTQDYTCCYLKVKFKNIEAGKKFTHYGCTQVHYNQFNDIKSTIKSYEAGNFTSSDGTQLEKFDVSIDCHSSLLKLTGLILLAFLL